MAESGAELEALREVARLANGLLGWLDNPARTDSMTSPAVRELRIIQVDCHRRALREAVAAVEAEQKWVAEGV